jgi:DNA modification methylase
LKQRRAGLSYREVNWPLAREQAANIAANQHGGEFDFVKLKDIIAEIDDGSLDTDLLGFEAEELTDMFGIVGAGTTEGEDDLPDVPETPVTKHGDLYALGNHRLLCGDSTDMADVLLLMDGKEADRVFTDPPWNVNYGASSNPRWKSRTIENDNLGVEFPKFLAGAVASISETLTAGGMVYVVMSAQEWPAIHKALTNADIHWSSTLIWVKDSLVLSRKDYHTSYEPIWYGWDGQGPRIVPLIDRTQDDVWEIRRPKVSELHPTTKPVELIEKAINNSSLSGNLILDLFLGSGSTLIACEKTRRTCYGMELDPHYCDVIVKRWEDFTGKQATKVTSGRD